MVRRKKSDAQALLKFFSQSGRLKSEKRRGWLMKLGLAHPESVADHTYRTALMALVLSDSRGLDTANAVRLALLHDLPRRRGWSGSWTSWKWRCKPGSTPKG